MLVDEAYITVTGGTGGDGRSSFFPGKGKTSPDGGTGGNGGNIIVRMNQQMYSLHRFTEQKEFTAEAGGLGQGFRRQGRAGKDLILEMPQGTSLIDQATREVVELTKDCPEIVLCYGGRGGRGNDSFKSSTNVAPRYAEKGQPGEERHFKLVMKLIADYGLVGLPNAGKSSLLNELTKAHAKVADYAFTTLEPNLGAINGKILADIPGLIEGASHGKGLGVKFLKHIEKVTLLIHCIASDSDDVIRDYEIVEKELEAFQTGLIQKSELILLTKIDLVSADEVKKQTEKLKRYGKTILPVSIHDWDRLQELKKQLP